MCELYLERMETFSNFKRFKSRITFIIYFNLHSWSVDIYIKHSLSYLPTITTGYLNSYVCNYASRPARVDYSAVNRWSALETPRWPIYISYY